jgi:hypothetical protein
VWHALKIRIAVCIVCSVTSAIGGNSSFELQFLQRCHPKKTTGSPLRVPSCRVSILIELGSLISDTNRKVWAARSANLGDANPPHFVSAIRYSKDRRDTDTHDLIHNIKYLIASPPSFFMHSSSFRCDTDTHHSQHCVSNHESKPEDVEHRKLRPPVTSPSEPTQRATFHVFLHPPAAEELSRRPCKPSLLGCIIICNPMNVQNPTAGVDQRLHHYGPCRPSLPEYHGICMTIYHWPSVCRKLEPSGSYGGLCISKHRTR